MTGLMMVLLAGLATAVPATAATAEHQDSQAAADDSCRYARDGDCDEPRYCAAGTDCTDCHSCDAGPRQVVDATTLSKKFMMGYQGWWARLGPSRSLHCSPFSNSSRRGDYADGCATTARRFATPCDGMGKGWSHWTRGTKVPGPDPDLKGFLNFDSWPDMSEFDPEELCPTNLVCLPSFDALASSPSSHYLFLNPPCTSRQLALSPSTTPPVFTLTRRLVAHIRRFNARYVLVPQ